jgi:hypothetical protein
MTTGHFLTGHLILNEVGVVQDHLLPVLRHPDGALPVVTRDVAALDAEVSVAGATFVRFLGCEAVLVALELIL